MANELALTTANRVEIVESVIQATLPAAEAITAGAPVRIDVTTGKFTNANATTAAEARIYGIATRTVAAGAAVTAIRKGVMDGWAMTAMAYDAAVYLNDTDGRIGTAAGTVSTVIGRVLPGTSTTLGTVFDKILSVEVGG
jgi:hypothetical protein